VASRLQKLQTFRSAKNLAKILEKVLASQLQKLYSSRRRVGYSPTKLLD